MRYLASALACLLIAGGAAKAELATSAKQLVGNWSCRTARDNVSMQLRFSENGMVAGSSGGQTLRGNYAIQSGNLSIVAGSQSVAATSLHIVGGTASAVLLDGDPVSCTRRGR